MLPKRFPEFRNRTVLITGGTMGIGLETGLAFARQGAQCFLTYKWGTADEEEVRRRFRQAGGLEPEIYRADAGSTDDTTCLLEEIRQRHGSIDVFVSNVSAAQIVGNLNDYSAKALFKTIGFSAWPMVDYTLRIREILGRYPRYVIGMSSTGVDSWACGYDLMAASKAVMETLCRYLSFRLKDEDVRVNVVRGGMVRTQSFEETFPADFVAFADRFAGDRYRLEAADIANAIVALCSGLMDAYTGQILTVDRGMSFFDNSMRLYAESGQPAG
jgi:NAD(P)-dependent dehydrogenase (short-subunit alcohol dehydrogenase family)